VFAPTESSSFVPKIEFVHLDPQYGGAKALLCTDAVELSDLTADSQTFALVVEDLTYEGEAWDGVLGLGFNNSYDNLIQTLYNQTQIEAPIFSLYFSKDANTDSKLILGGIDKDYIDGEIKLLDLEVGQNYWTVNLEVVDIMTETIYINSQAVFDLSTPFIFVPHNDLYRIYDTLKRKYDCQNGPQIHCSCDYVNDFPNITFTMAGRFIELPPEGYVQYNSSYGECVLLLEESQTEKWVIGTSFLRQFYSVFSLPVNGSGAYIGLAKPAAYHHSGNGEDSTDDLLGLKIGLPIGGVIALGAIGVVCCLCIRKRKAKKAMKNQENKQNLIVYVAPDLNTERMPEEPRLIENADGAHREVRPIVVINEPDKNTQTVFYPFLPPVSVN